LLEYMPSISACLKSLLSRPRKKSSKSRSAVDRDKAGLLISRVESLSEIAETAGGREGGGQGSQQQQSRPGLLIFLAGLRLANTEEIWNDAGIQAVV